MDHGSCQLIVAGLSTAVVALAGSFMKVLLWWKKESEGRLHDSQALSKIVGGGDETRVQ